MSVRIRSWHSPAGELKNAWVVDYFDQHGRRHLKTFARKRDADSFHAQVTIDVRAGTHTADSTSISIAQAGEFWLQDRTAAGLEPTTLVAYEIYVTRHITPRIGTIKLSQLTVPGARAFEDQLKADCSPVHVRAIMRALGAILDDAQERGLVAQNVVRSLRRRRHKGRDQRHDRRRKGKLKIGVNIPAPEEIKAIVAALANFPRWRPLLLTAIFTGLRPSELRGLRWVDVDLKRGELHVRQRADALNKIGPPKSEAGERTVPLPPMLVNVLREWKLACPHSELGLAFPTERGKVLTRKSIAENGWQAAQIAAGVTRPVLDSHDRPKRDQHGKPIVAAKYPGLHALRHFYASWCINRKVDGGLELPLKVVQARLGHATITMTADRYGHLFPRTDDGAELAAAERAFLIS
jgi:integrase